VLATGINIGITMGLLSSICMQGLLPTDAAQMATTGFWRIILGMPLVCCIIGAIIFSIIIRYDSIDFLIDKMAFDEAR